MPLLWRHQRCLRQRSVGAVAALLIACGFMAFCERAIGSDSEGADPKSLPDFQKDIQPILVKYCYDCHGDGGKEGQVAFDELKVDEAASGKHAVPGTPELWWNALRNVRAGLMPAEGSPGPNADEMRQFERWIKFVALGNDADNPDPGRVTLRRLNRTEYRNTIRDLMGTDFKVEEELPPDDSGYGFDNIGDVLTMSPLLMEKYMEAAKKIVAKAVPTKAREIPKFTIGDAEFRGKDDENLGSRFSFYEPTRVFGSMEVKQAGTYRIALDMAVEGEFEFDPGKCRVVFKVDDQPRFEQEYGWENYKKFEPEFEFELTAGKHSLSLELEPLTPVEKRINALDLQFYAVHVLGPYEERHWVAPKNYTRFFFDGEPPVGEAGQRKYAREVLARFTKKAFRQPVDDVTLDRLQAIAEMVYRQPDKRFEEGVAQAMIAVLASPRFLFRLEEPEVAGADGPAAKYPFVDEYTLASRLSYFLWSTMPDDELFRLADRGELRKNLKQQIDRMLGDWRAESLSRNFVGQWLQARDVEGVAINERTVIGREDDELRELVRQVSEGRRREGRRRRFDDPERRRWYELYEKLRNYPLVELTSELRRAMRQESEMCFSYIVEENRSVLELLDADYTFVNNKLAKHYGLPEVKGRKMRRVELPKGSHRGGVLTQGTMLVVTSNPTRTSPVKRGVYLLDNILGTPPPPPPPNIPALEASQEEADGRELSMRELMEVHRSKPLCSSCHSRMDPIGLGLENFNAMGMWREKDVGQPVEPAGQLVTGEEFNDVRELKKILINEHRMDFYRCLTEKLLTYALGRGLTNQDVHTVDTIVERLEQNDGRFSELLVGVVESAPFQKQREAPVVAVNESTQP